MLEASAWSQVVEAAAELVKDPSVTSGDNAAMMKARTSRAGAGAQDDGGGYYFTELMNTSECHFYTPRNNYVATFGAAFWEVRPGVFD